MDRQAVVEPARDHRSGIELRTELDGHGEPSLAVHRVPVLAGEHLSGLPLCWWPDRWVGPVGPYRGIPHFSPLCATSLHSTARFDPVKIDFARICGWSPGRNGA